MENSILGIRSRIAYGTVIKITYVMGNDYYESLEDMSVPGKIPMGIGADCYIENAIIDEIFLRFWQICCNPAGRTFYFIKTGRSTVFTIY